MGWTALTVGLLVSFWGVSLATQASGLLLGVAGIAAVTLIGE